MAFWPHRIDEGEPGSGGRKPVPDLEHLRQALQHRFERALSPLAALLHRLGASADQVSVTGFVLNAAAAALIVTGDLVAAGALYLFAGLLDLLDGVLARTGGKPDPVRRVSRLHPGPRLGGGGLRPPSPTASRPKGRRSTRASSFSPSSARSS